MKNIQEKKVTASQLQEAVGQTILELTEWIQSVCRDSSVNELDRLSEIVTATSELYKSFKH
ncbi:hypothetical protein [Bacillus cereus]|uniref:Uncharacterized protein n=1 Tax=Bacillus cereus MC67 TaxID=1053219 RepID=J8ENC0_BACCE|nr:hypothetical protein [Bacillus cereus]EJQ90030.1 hypothetical protein II3_05715 [Bacillus cereus MC67]EOO99726.1 hypothetical protein II1_05334 [Bacillus cereus MC118]PEW60467.1 hypothetical protein CN448_30860 [Bacillus cereus]